MPGANASRFLINPDTGYIIKYQGPTHRRLLAEGQDPRVLRMPKGGTRPWRETVEMNTKRRQAMHEQCGGCFLLPPRSKYNPSDRPKFPVCDAAAGGGWRACRVSCRGLVAAVRDTRWVRDPEARRYVQGRAARLLRRYCGAAGEERETQPTPTPRP